LSSSSSDSTIIVTPLVTGVRARKRGIGRGHNRGGRTGGYDAMRIPLTGWHDQQKATPQNRFVEEFGLQGNLTFDDTELQYLNFIVGDDFFNVLAENTNLQAVFKSPPANYDFLLSICHF